MRRWVSVILVSALALCCVMGLASCGGSDEPGIVPEGTYSRDLAGTTINVYNWGEYISDGSDDSLDVNEEFEKLTGIRVNYSMYESNEVMYSKLKSEAVAYDVIIPSDYMIARLLNEDMLRKIDFSKLSNYHYIDPKYRDLYFDPTNEYSVPYNVGMVGIIYNTTMVEGTPDSWSLMWDEKYSDNILTFNNSRDGFATAQFLLGLDVNSTDKATWEQAAEKLKEQSPILQGRVMDEIFNKMENNNAAIAPYYAGDFLTMQEINPDLAFYYPKEGTNIFVDSICVPASSQNYEAAMMYINFLLEPEIALANAEYIRYASPNTAVVNSDDYSLKGNEILYPAAEATVPVEYYHDLEPEIRSYYETLWEDIVRSTT